MALMWTPRRITLAALAVAACLMLGGLYWCSTTLRKIDRCIGGSTMVSAVLQAYAKDHAGRLPSSLNELIQTGYLHCDNNGDLRLAETVGHGSSEGVSLFDVAWGATPEETDENGYMTARGRFLIVPAQGSPCELGWCEGTSKQVAREMRAAAQSPQPGSRQRPNGAPKIH